MPTPNAEWPKSKMTPPLWLALALVLLLQLLVGVDVRGLVGDSGMGHVVHIAALIIACAALVVSAIAVASRPRFSIWPTAFVLVVLLELWVLLFP